MEKQQIIDAILQKCKEMETVLEKHQEEIVNDHTPMMEYEIICDILRTINGDIAKHINGLKGYRFASLKDKKMKSETLKPLNENDVINKDTPFYNKKVVFTGNLIEFPEREKIAELLRNYGANINGSISKLTDYVIMGHGAGPSKVAKIKELRDAGYEINVLGEREFKKILKEYHMI